ncbi:MAG: molecular chaperone HtpG [Bryobacteraceae bacterium]
MAENSGNQFEFKAEIRQLLDILVHSLYTNKEVFLRELISNASDALDKLRFEATRGTAVADPELELEIRIQLDKERKMLVLSDTGIGMTRDEVISNIGTIARSGSAEFLKQAGTGADMGSIIGKFGVGFYSVFMVARQVVIRTRSFRPEDVPVEWRSEGTGTYEVSDVEGPVKRGTTIEVLLRDEAVEFLEPYRVRSVIQKHSNFISFPIFVNDDRVNTVAAVWREPKFKVKKEQYDEFYKFLTLDSEPPMDTLHQSVDAPVQFYSLLFIPKQGEALADWPREDTGLDLYVRRVMIQHKNKDLVPEHLGFLRGVVDSEDLPLNISRETLQENTMLLKISQTVVKNVLAHLAKMAKDESERYVSFWRSHGRRFKLGYGDYANREKWAELLRFNSSHHEDAAGLTALEEYCSRAKPGQNQIYYVTGHGRDALRTNPHLDVFRAKGLEVLYLYEPVDEFALESLGKFRDFTLQSVEHADSKTLDGFATVQDAGKPEPLSPDDGKAMENLAARIREILGGRVTAVKLSGRLHESPCCLANPDGVMTSSMQKVLQIMNKDASIPQKVFEVNQDHRIFRNLLEVFKKDSSDPYLALAVEQLFESALLMEGYLRDPHAMVNRIQELLGKSSEWYLASR